MNRIYWNDGWDFSPCWQEELKLPACQLATEPVRLPHTMVQTPYNCFDESIYQLRGGYRRVFTPLDCWQGQRVLLTVEAAGHYAEVYLNGVLLCTHADGYTAFTAELSEALLWGQENILAILVDSWESLNQPPFGQVIDYMTYGGLYREVYIDILPQRYIRDVFAKVISVSTQNGLTGTVHIQCDCTLEGSPCGSETILHTLIDPAGKTAAAFAGDAVIEAAQLWHPEHPVLYTLKSTLTVDGVLVHKKETRIGLRRIAFDATGLRINGAPFKLRGLNRHQCFPYVGYAMPKSMQYADAEILKNELCVNAVRTSHYPQSHHFLDRCDELGLLVFTEIPGWQHIGNDVWKEQAIENTRQMVVQYRNHPSIFIWGVRINESVDDDAFYTQTNQAAHSLDPTRPTSGVRYLEKSSLLEDVYAFNDFSHNGKTPGCSPKKKVSPDLNKGYLISEYNGHMFPTKSFDSEEHRQEHLLRHARVMDAWYQAEDIAGGFGWCMFDYNTHRDFGSGDRICYHGVMDMFRNPKLAAALYQAQGEAPVLEISSAMDIGEHPGGTLPEVYAVTNAKAIAVYKNGNYVGQFHTTPFPHLPHGPICIDDLIGELLEKGEGWPHAKAEDAKTVLLSINRNGFCFPPAVALTAAKCLTLWKMTIPQAVELYNRYIGNWGGHVTTYQFEAIRNGQKAESVCCAPVTQIHLKAIVSSQHLVEDTTYDVAAVRIQAVSQLGNPVPWYQEPVLLEAEGALEIIGPKIISLKGGMGGTYVKTIGKSGEGTLTIRSEQAGAQTISFTIKIQEEQA